MQFGMFSLNNCISFNTRATVLRQINQKMILRPTVASKLKQIIKTHTVLLQINALSTEIKVNNTYHNSDGT